MSPGLRSPRPVSFRTHHPDYKASFPSRADAQRSWRRRQHLPRSDVSLRVGVGGVGRIAQPRDLGVKRAGAAADRSQHGARLAPPGSKPAAAKGPQPRRHYYL